MRKGLEGTGSGEGDGSVERDGPEKNFKKNLQGIEKVFTFALPNGMEAGWLL